MDATRQPSFRSQWSREQWAAFLTLLVTHFSNGMCASIQVIWWSKSKVVTCAMWHVTCDMLHAKCDMWHNYKYSLSTGSASANWAKLPKDVFAHLWVFVIMSHVTCYMSHVTCLMSNAYVDPWDMLNNFCFQVYAQKWVLAVSYTHLTLPTNREV